LNFQIIQMDDDSCVLKYIEIVPLNNSAEHFEELKPFEVKVLLPVNFLYAYSTSWATELNALLL